MDNKKIAEELLKIAKGLTGRMIDSEKEEIDEFIEEWRDENVIIRDIIDLIGGMDRASLQSEDSVISERGLKQMFGNRLLPKWIADIFLRKTSHEYYGLEDNAMEKLDYFEEQLKKKTAKELSAFVITEADTNREYAKKCKSLLVGVKGEIMKLENGVGSTEDVRKKLQLIESVLDELDDEIKTSRGKKQQR